MISEKLEKLLKGLNLTENEISSKRKMLEIDMEQPVKIIGIGQCGVGKTELLRSIFKIRETDIKEYLAFKGSNNDYDRLITGSVKAVTKEFFSFIIENEDGLKVMFTDGPGLGESDESENEYISKWVNEIPKHDLLYWVLDASSRDMAHIQKNIKCILDNTGYRNKVVVVLNKIDQILLPIEMELKGVVGWDFDFNCPTPALLKLINQRTDDIIEKLSKYVNINKNQVVICSARKRWNHGAVLDKILEYLPENKRIKVSVNREVKDTSELMTDKGKNIIGKKF